MVKKPKPAGVSQGNRNWRPLLDLLAPQSLRVLAISVISFTGAILEAGVLITVTAAALAVTGGEGHIEVLGQDIAVTLALGLLAVVLAARLALALWGVRLSAELTARVIAQQRQRLLKAYLNARWEIQQAEPAGRLQELLTTFVERITGAVNTFGAWISSMLSLTAFLVMAIWVDVTASVALLLALGALAALLRPLRKRIGLRAGAYSRTGLEFTNAASELGSLGLEMQAFGVRSQFAERMQALSDKNVRARFRLDTFNLAVGPTYITLAYGALILGIAAMSFIGSSDLGAVGAVFLLMLRSLTYGQSLQTTSAGVMASLPYIERIQETVVQYEAAASAGGTAQPAAAAPIALEGVSFSYAPGAETLRDINITIAPGESLGVIGPSGAGKSTLIQLVLGLREPTEGTVRAGGVKLADVDRSWWSSRVAFVPQDARLFTGTVMENIQFFRDIPLDAVQRAAAQANLLTDIAGMPGGLDHHLGERGSQLSGGQAQRISIARALAGNPEVLILDEPTSALDSRSEALIRDTLNTLHGNVTVIIIAHRLSTLNSCDRIAVIEDGAMTGLGSREELRLTSPYYRNVLANSDHMNGASVEEDN